MVIAQLRPLIPVIITIKWPKVLQAKENRLILTPGINHHQFAHWHHLQAHPPPSGWRHELQRLPLLSAFRRSTNYMTYLHLNSLVVKCTLQNEFLQRFRSSLLMSQRTNITAGHSHAARDQSDASIQLQQPLRKANRVAILHPVPR